MLPFIQNQSKKRALPSEGLTRPPKPTNDYGEYGTVFDHSDNDDDAFSDVVRLKG